MNKELPYHTSYIVQRYLQLKKIAHYESGVIISVLVSLFVLSLVFLGSHLGNGVSIDPVKFLTITDGGGIKVLGVSTGLESLYGPFYPYLLLGTLEQNRGVWVSDNNILMLGVSGGTILPRYVTNHYVFPKYTTTRSDTEYEQYLQAMNSSVSLPIQKIQIEEKIVWNDITNNFFCLGRSRTPGYFCKNKLLGLIDVIPYMQKGERNLAYSTIALHVDNPQFQPVCSALLQTIIFKKDYSTQTDTLIRSCIDKSLTLLYEQSKQLEEFHQFLDNPKIVVSFAGVKNSIIQQYILSSLMQQIIHGINLDQDNVIMLESLGLTIDTLEGQNNLDPVYIGLLHYFNTNKLQPYFNGKVGATINQKETYDRLTTSFKRLTGTNIQVKPQTGTLQNITGVSQTGTLQIDWNKEIKNAFGLTPDKLLITDTKITSLFIVGGKRYIINILLGSGKLVEGYKSEPGIGNTKIFPDGLIFDIKNYVTFASIFAALHSDQDVQTPKTLDEWYLSFESVTGITGSRIVFRGDIVVISFVRNAAKYAFIISKSTIKLYELGGNDGNNLISTLDGTWSKTNFIKIKSILP